MNMSSFQKTSVFNQEFHYYLKEKKILFLSGYQDKTSLNNHLQNIGYLSRDNNKVLLKIFINNFNSDNGSFLGFLNNLYLLESFYGVIGCGVIPKQSLVIISGGVQDQRKVFSNTSIYLNYDKSFFFDKYENIPGNSFSNNFHILFIDRIMRINSKILDEKNKKLIENKFHMYERKFFMSNSEAIELGIIDNILY
mmetsp:Transcript_29901/g.58447  ORF Transcript_29901/g.58447 Transcript_29901/m.58447 type:complete len:195 (+) Transcript_29901:268-852(+)